MPYSLVTLARAFLSLVLFSVLALQNASAQSESGEDSRSGAADSEMPAIGSLGSANVPDSAVLDEAYGAEDASDPAAPAGPAGILAGAVFDAGTGRPIRGAAILIRETNQVGQTDTDGQYRITDVPPGTYRVSFLKSGYQTTSVTDVEIRGDEVTTQNLELGTPPATAAGDSQRGAGQPGDRVLTLETLEVTSTQVANDRLAMEALRQRSVGAINAISSEDMSRLALGDAAEALQKVPGVSIVDGEYASVRGMFDRYGNTTLNGQRLPSPDPEKQAVPLDIFPSGLLSSVVVSKTFTPDLPGDSSGGSVDVRTRDFPDRRQFKVSFGVEYVENTSENDQFLSYDQDRSADWFAAGKNERDKPDIPFNTPSIDLFETPDIDEGEAISPLFKPATFAEPDGAPGPDFDFSISYGDTLKLFGRDFGFVAAVDWDRGYDDRILHSSRLVLAPQPGAVPGGDPAKKLQVEPRVNLLRADIGRRSEIETDLGGVLSMSYNILDGHSLRFNAMHVRSASDIALEFDDGGFGVRQQFLEGSIRVSDVPDIREEIGFTNFRQGFPGFPETVRLPVVIQGSSFYRQRTLTSFQLSGEHAFERLGDLLLNWDVSTAEVTQDVPDARRYNAELSGNGDNVTFTTGGVDTLADGFFSRFWTSLTEQNDSIKADAELPFTFLGDRGGLFKAGFAFDGSERDFRRDEFEMVLGGSLEEGPASGFVYRGTRSVVGGITVGSLESAFDERTTFTSAIDFSLLEQIDFPLFAIEVPAIADGVRSAGLGKRDVTAGYAMAELPLFGSFRLVAGARFERTEFDVTGVSNAAVTLEIPGFNRKSTDDRWLPSATFIWDITDTMSLRMAFSKTLARPSLREITPVLDDTEEGSFKVLGNGLGARIRPPNVRFERVEDLWIPVDPLTLSDITNYDLRWEWFVGDGLVAASVFYKEIEKPIERTSIAGIGFLDTWVNNDRGARLYGVEFELRQNLGRLAFGQRRLNWLRDMAVNLNFTFIDAQARFSSLETAIKELEIEDPFAFVFGPQGTFFGSLLNQGLGSGSRRLQGQPELIFNGDLQYIIPRLDTNVTVAYSYRSEVLDRVGGLVGLDIFEDSIETLDLIITQPLGENWTIRFSAENLTAGDRVLRYGGPDSGLPDNLIFESYKSNRTFKLSASYSFE